MTTPYRTGARWTLRLLVASLLLLAACGRDTAPGDPAKDAPPTITIVTLGDGPEVDAGTPLALEATATDAEDGDLSETVAWSSDGGGPLGTGGRIDVTLAEGRHVITARVEDTAGQAAETSVAVEVRPAPPGAPRLVPSEIEAGPGEEADLVVEPASAAQGATWRSEDEDVATVDDVGRVTTVGPGTTRVIATLPAASDAEVAATVRVVLPDLQVTNVRLEPHPAPTGATVRVTWTVESSDFEVACRVEAPASTEGSVEIPECQEGTSSAELTFPSAGRFTVRITADRELDGEDDREERTVVVGLPSVSIDVVAPASPLAREATTFEVVASDPDGTTVVCTLDPGDGSPVVELGACGGAAVRTEHVYAAEGSYAVTVVAEDADGSVVERTRSVAIGPPAPLEVSLTSSEWGGSEGDTIAFEVHTDGGVADPSVAGWVMRRVDGPIVDAVHGPDAPAIYRRAFAASGSYRIEVEVTDGASSIVRERTVTIVEADLGPKPDVVLFGFAGRCGADCDADGNSAYLEEPGRETLTTLAAAFQASPEVDDVLIYDLRAHLLDSDVHGRGFQSAALLAERMTDAWIDGAVDPTRLVVVGYSHGSTFASLLSFAHPDVPFAYGVYLDAVCDAAGVVSFDDDFLGPDDDFARAYGERSAHPSPLDTQSSACSGYPVTGSGSRGIDNVVPYGIETALEVQSGGESGLSFIADQVDNLRPDGSTTGIVTQRFPQEQHRGIERRGSDAMTWLVQAIEVAEGP